MVQLLLMSSEYKGDTKEIKIRLNQLRKSIASSNEDLHKINTNRTRLKEKLNKMIIEKKYLEGLIRAPGDPSKVPRQLTLFNF